MRFFLTGLHRKLFFENKYIEFENIFSLTQIEEIHRSIQKTCALNRPHPYYDVWRVDPFIKNFICQKKLVELLFQLTKQKKIYLAFDLVFSSSISPSQPLISCGTLQEWSCIEPLSCAFLIQLQGNSIPLPYAPKQRTNLVMLSPDILLDWKILYQESATFLLVAYTNHPSFYLLKQKNPCTHEFKRIGYVVGDRLHPSLNPLFFF